jgi:hypothetical protein
VIRSGFGSIPSSYCRVARTRARRTLVPAFWRRSMTVSDRHVVSAISPGLELLGSVSCSEASRRGVGEPFSSCACVGARLIAPSAGGSYVEPTPSDHFSEVERRGHVVPDRHRDEHATCCVVQGRGLVVVVLQPLWRQGERSRRCPQLLYARNARTHTDSRAIELTAVFLDSRPLAWSSDFRNSQQFEVRVAAAGRRKWPRTVKTSRSSLARPSKARPQ